jgi:hypothetical protein
MSGSDADKVAAIVAARAKGIGIRALLATWNGIAGDRRAYNTVFPSNGTGDQSRRHQSVPLRRADRELSSYIPTAFPTYQLLERRLEKDQA